MHYNFVSHCGTICILFSFNLYGFTPKPINHVSVTPYRLITKLFSLIFLAQISSSSELFGVRRKRTYTSVIIVKNKNK